MKTDKQELLEIQRNSDIRTILIDMLEDRKGRPNIAMRVAMDLNVTPATVY